MLICIYFLHTCLHIIKVPQVTIYFWVIKVCCTTVGETFSDFMVTGAPSMGLPLGCLMFGGILIAALALQFRVERYFPVVYWFAVVLTSIEGTLITDNMTDNIGVPLWLSSLVFAVALALVFLGWYRSEGTLDIHSVDHWKRESWYWLTIIITFALGTSFGDLLSEKVFKSFIISTFVFLGACLVVAVLSRLELKYFGQVPCFWTAYVLTRPLGASIGDLFSQPQHLGGLGAGTVVTSCILLSVIVILVGFLQYTQQDIIVAPDDEEDAKKTKMEMVVVEP
jgi:uncharacterized membrane-anchored protein